MSAKISEFDLTVRYQVYQHFAEHCVAPTFQQIADLLKVEHEPVRVAFHKLHEGHMIFMEPGADSIRMANPFSAIPTDFKVQAGQKEWWANCAWDTLGIAATLGIDVEIEGKYPDSDDVVNLAVRDGKVKGGDPVTYFPLPCRYWYDDLIFT